MTKKQAIQNFNKCFPKDSFMRDHNGKPYVDRPMRDQAWNNYTDALCKSRDITERQYETWVSPFRD